MQAAFVRACARQRAFEQVSERTPGSLVIFEATLTDAVEFFQKVPAQRQDFQVFEGLQPRHLFDVVRGEPQVLDLGELRSASSHVGPRRKAQSRGLA